MRQAEWSRSRYWHCYFLQSRHERPRVPWTSDPRVSLEAGETAWLHDVRSRCGAAEGWLIQRAAADHASDPAYVQTLRLVVREQQYHGQLLDRWLKQAHGAALQPPRPHPLLHAGRLLSVRYTLSVILLDDLLDLALARLLSGTTGDPALKTILDTLRQDKSAHVAFAVERLTMEFADFNAMRRNLRRLRLRAMFAARLAHTLAVHRGLLGPACASFAAQQWHEFNRLLEEMVPYRREKLMAALLEQERQPYGRARVGR